MGLVGEAMLRDSGDAIGLRNGELEVSRGDCGSNDDRLISTGREEGEGGTGEVIDGDMLAV